MPCKRSHASTGHHNRSSAAKEHNGTTPSLLTNVNNTSVRTCLRSEIVCAGESFSMGIQISAVAITVTRPPTKNAVASNARSAQDIKPSAKIVGSTSVV